MRTRKNIWPFSGSKATSARNTTPASGGIAAHSKRRAAPAKGAKSAPAKSAGARDIDEAKLAAHFKRGGTLAEFLKQNPADVTKRYIVLKDGKVVLSSDDHYAASDLASRLKAESPKSRVGFGERRSNPVEVTDRAHRYRAQKNVTGPRVCVLCGSRRNIDVMHLDGNESNDEPKNLAYGCRSCNATLGAAFKRAGMGRPTNQYNPASNRVPTFAQYAWAVSQGGPNGHHWETGGAHDEAGAVIHATPKSKRIEYARRIAESKGLRSRARDDERWNPTWDGKPVTAAEREQRYQEEDSDREAAERHAQWVRDQFAKKAAERNARWVREHEAKRSNRRNPADAAAAGYEDFHGAPPSEFVKVRERVHVHKYLSGAGVLKRLVVAAIDGKAEVKLSGFGKRCLLAFNEKRNQLFIVGGDQAVDLAAFGIDPAGAHELETLGRVTKIGYHTTKEHLGDEGGEALYLHVFRMTNENGRHVTVRVARYPDLIYRVRDEKLEFSGGSYTIVAEGIDR